ncbi:hypothetical protein JW979_16570 [bacterium]|nr:hypothetical protein [candidate division CSSED10-310 bacterium]
MLESVEDLVSSLGILSNHFKKALRVVEENSAPLHQRLDECGLIGHVRLWRKAHNYNREMETIISVAKDAKEIRSFLGTYVILQQLQLHFLNIDWLRRESTNHERRIQVYQHILIRLRFQLKNLISSYLKCLIKVIAGDIPFEGIAIGNVGMILDQDDLDVGVFIKKSIDKTFWNRVISQVSNEFLKYSTKMHFYLSERVASSMFLTTLEDFKSYLNRGVGNFVLISELLLTEYLLGDETLIKELETAIINQFYFDSGNLRLHEGYLRGMMGEVQELLRFDMNSPWISPKNHGLRLIHSLMNMLKTIHGVHEHGSRDTIEILRQKEVQTANVYQNLQNIFNFLEMFFYVYQLLVSVDDTFDFSDETNLDNLDHVANIMGFTSLGAVRPALRLMTHYYENMDYLCHLGKKIVDWINQHLKKITVFNGIMAGTPPDNYPVKWTRNKALNILKMFKIFKGMIYWDDVLQILGENNGKLIVELIQNIEDLPPKRGSYAFIRFLRLLLFDMDSMVMTGALFAQYLKTPSLKKYFVFMKKWLNDQLEKKPNRMGAFVSLLITHPDILTQYLLALDKKELFELREYTQNLGKTVEIDESLRNKFIMLMELLALSSNNYRRLYARVAKEKPEIVTNITSMAVLNGISEQLWAELSDAVTPQELKKKLATYYEFSFCRCGLLAINQPGNLKMLYGSYHSFFRRYFRWLFRACQWEVESEGNFEYFFRERDENAQPFAIFCTGGYAREEAFENDIDLFVLSWDSNPNFIKYASRVINGINRELSRRGVIPHYRFAEFFNSFVIPVNDLELFLAEPREDDFIEYSQLLGSRLLVGGQSLDIEISKLLEKYLFKNPERFIKQMFSDLECRHSDEKKSRERKERTVNVKEDYGALRDIQTVVAVAQANIGIKEPVIWKAFQHLSNELPNFQNDFKILERAYHFMRFFRDTYAITLSEADDIMRDRLASTAHWMGIEEKDIDGEEGSAPKLLNSYRYHRNRSRQAISNIFKYFLTVIS